MTKKPKLTIDEMRCLEASGIIASDMIMEYFIETLRYKSKWKHGENATHDILSSARYKLSELIRLSTKNRVKLPKEEKNFMATDPGWDLLSRLYTDRID